MNAILVFAVKRFLAMIVIIWVIVTVVFFLAHLTPYDPITLLLGAKARQEHLAYLQLRHLYGLDQTLWQQYLNYTGGLLHGNLGYAEEQGALGTPVWSILRSGVPVSLRLGGYALLVALLVGLPVGLISAIKQNSAIDHFSQTAVIVAFAVPSFVFAPICQLIFGVELKWLPVAGWGDPGVLGLKELIMPVLIFAAGLAGFFAKSFRSFMLEVLGQDYIRTARAKGLKEQRVVILHAMKNTLIPLATIVGPILAFLIVGAFIIELFFSIPGIGNITVNAVIASDYPVIEATTILLAVAVVVVNFLTDIFYALIDPRVRL
ncbi:MAG: ABC transporter permease [Chloroflexota bacterium]|nr:MAG: ABC transporter permease [Chloroflexota bacterium]